MSSAAELRGARAGGEASGAEPAWSAGCGGDAKQSLTYPDWCPRTSGLGRAGRGGGRGARARALLESARGDSSFPGAPAGLRKPRGCALLPAGLLRPVRQCL